MKIKNRYGTLRLYGDKRVNKRRCYLSVEDAQFNCGYIFLTPKQLRRLAAECERLADELEAGK